MKKPTRKFGNKNRQGDRAGVLRRPRSETTFDQSDLWIAFGLAISTLALYAQVVSHQFINFDDDLYIWNNPTVSSGVTLKGIAWAFTSFDSGIWHPLTWLSHMIDTQIFGLNAGAHLFMNALIHVANSLLLFVFLRRATGARWESAIVAALFALHPLHVESVAWASERKDTLSTFFGIVCLLAYTRYVEQPSWKRYLLVAFALALGLMAKPMLVTWPLVMLLLDYWPFARIEWRTDIDFKRFAKAWWPLIREKLPLCLIVAPFLFVTYFTQAHEGAVADSIAAPLSWRVANSLVSYAKYLFLTFWPQGLAIYYPSVDYTPAWQWVTAVILLVVITAVAFHNAKERPYVISGWLWFLGTLVPVIGLVQIGSQAMADRYTYVPSIGLFVALVFGLGQLARSWGIGRVAVTTASTAVILVLAALTVWQVRRWHDSETLFTYVLSVTSDNRVIQNNLGSYLGQQGRHGEAITHFAEALRIKPDYFDALENMGFALMKQGKTEEAIDLYQRMMRMKPESPKIHLQLGRAFADQGKNEEAVREFRRALEVAPNDFESRMNLGQMLTRQGNLSEATAQLNEAVRLRPDSPEAHNDLGIALIMAGQPEGSLAHFSTALRLKPDFAVAQDNLRRAQKQLEAQQK